MTWIFSIPYASYLHFGSTSSLSHRHTCQHTFTRLGWTVTMAVDDDYNPDQEDDAASDHLDDDNAPGPSKRKAAAAAAGGADDVRFCRMTGVHLTRQRFRTDSRLAERLGKGRIERHGTWCKRTRRAGFSIPSTRSWRGLGASGKSKPVHAPLKRHHVSKRLMDRAMMDEAPLRRSIIRHMFLIIDLSDSMNDRDFRPTR